MKLLKIKYNHVVNPHYNYVAGIIDGVGRLWYVEKINDVDIAFSLVGYTEVNEISANPAKGFLYADLKFRNSQPKRYNWAMRVKDINDHLKDSDWRFISPIGQRHGFFCPEVIIKWRM